MDLRHIENIVVDEAVLHVLDQQMDEPLLGAVGLDITSSEVNEFIVKHVIKALTDEAAIKGKFLPGTIMETHSKNLLDPDQFMETSKALAKRLFDLNKQANDTSCDLLCIRFHTGNIDAFGVLRMDYQMSYTHEIAFEASVFKINLVAQEVALPTQQQKVNQCYFGSQSGTDTSYDIIMLSKKRSSDDEEKERFVKKFLNAEHVKDYKDQTRSIKKTVEQWAQKNLKEDFDTAQELRKNLDEKLRYHAVISAEDLTKEALAHDAEARLSLRTKLEQEGIPVEERFEVDKRYVDKKMKTKTIRTDTGFVIRADYELFDEEGFIEVQRNGDGTVNYIIKNVRNVKER